MNSVKIGLCQGRHDIPGVSSYIYSQAINPLDVDGLEATAKAALHGHSSVELYVTGLTVALVAALNAARELKIAVTLMHFDRESGGYYPQEVK